MNFDIPPLKNPTSATRKIHKIYQYHFHLFFPRTCGKLISIIDVLMRKIVAIRVENYDDLFC